MTFADPAIRARRRGLSALLAACSLVLGLLIGMPQARAAAGIRLSLDRDVIGLGDSASLKVTIEGGNGQEQPRMPAVQGLQFTKVGNNMSFSFVNGRQNVMAESVYLINSTRVGNYVLGPVEAEVGNQTVRSDTLSLRVVQPDDPAAARADGLDKAAFLRLQLPARDAYVGETFVAEIQLYALGGRLQQVPQLQADGFTVGKLQDGGQEGNIRTNNRIYSRARFLQPVTAARSGTLEMQALNCILDVPMARRGGAGDFFDEAFFGLRESKRLTLSSPSVPVNVRPLPRENIPAGFSGAVGEFQIALTASPTNARAGDPITVSIEISGRGNFDAVQWKEPGEWREFRLYPPNATFQTEDPLGIVGTKRFEQVVTPESPSVTELPAVAFSFFSPESKNYRVVRTRAVPLSIAPGAATPVIPNAANAAAHADLPGGTVVPDLAPLRPHLGTWSPAASAGTGQPWFLGLTALPWIGWVAWNAVASARRRFGADAATLRRRELEQSLRKGLAALETHSRSGDGDAFFSQLFRVLQDSVAVKSGQPPASITEGDLEAVLAGRGVDDATLTELHQLFQSCNHARYARTRDANDLESLRQRTVAAVAKLTS